MEPDVSRHFGWCGTRAAVAAVLLLATAASGTAESEWKHGLSLMGEPKYPADFKHFSYVNPNAPKGGVVRFGQDGSFDSFNFVIPRGTAAAGITNIYDTLMNGSLDEVATEYGLLAEAVRHPPDWSSVTYRLRKEARWHDGKPVTPDDVVWTFENLVKLSPNYRFYYRHVTKAEKSGEREVTFTFDSAGNRELPQIVGQLVVLPKHWWTGADAQGRQRDINAGTLEPPLGSGPYRIKNFVAGRSVAYERVPDYWGAKVPAKVGTENFDEIRYEYFRDDTVELEAFKADQYDFRVENSARNWATAYDFPARRENRVVLETFPERARGVMQAFVPNLRREKFKDPRLRFALRYALDVEDMNHTLFFGQYKPINSYFAGTELASSGMPQGKELAILETVRGQVPPEVFTREFRNPVGGNEEARRTNLREATRLLREAGFEIRDRRLVNAKTGEPFTIEFLLNGPSFERHVLFYRAALERLGIPITLRIVDSSQYINRLRGRDFDMVVAGWGQSLSPGNEQLDFWGSEAADREASRNYAGIKDPAVDALIKRVIFANDREELKAATHALDRVLLWNHFVVPTWTIDATRTARWDRYGRPDKLPEYSFGFPDIWWFDKDRAAKAGARQ
jgi:microcin C transport system substrate-binding protein